MENLKEETQEKDFDKRDFESRVPSYYAGVYCLFSSGILGTALCVCDNIGQVTCLFL